MLGTPEYMAPEVISDGYADPRSDIYSLGVVLFEAATGRLPFRGDSPYQLLRQHLDVEAPPRAAAVAPELPEAIDEAIARALGKEPLDRFASADGLARGDGADAPPPSRALRGRARRVRGGDRARRLPPLRRRGGRSWPQTCVDCGAAPAALEHRARRRRRCW